MKKENKNHFSGYFISLGIIISMVVIFLIYFYNVFVNFQISYAGIHNESTIEKAKELHEGIIRVSGSFFTDIDINRFMNNSDELFNADAIKKIKNIISTSSIGEYVSETTIDIPKDERIYFSTENKKLTYDNFRDLYPQYEFLLNNSEPGVSFFTENEFVIYSFNDNRGYVVSMFIRKNVLENNILDYEYPIFYGTALCDANSREIISDFETENGKILNKLEGSENSAVKLHGNYLMIKNSSSIYSSVSVFKISDMIAESLKTGGVLIAFIVFIAIMIAIFYRRHKKILTEQAILEEYNTFLNTNMIIQKIFNCGAVTKKEEVTFNEYFLLNDATYMLPVVIGIMNYDLIEEKSGYRDMSVYKYGFENIIEEVMSEIANVKITGIGKENIGVLLYSSTPVDSDAVREKAEFFTGKILEIFNVSLFSLVGSWVEDVMSVQEQVAELINFQKYKLIKKSDTVMFYSEEQNTNSPYPTEIQTEIIESIKSGDDERIQQHIQRFTQYTTENNPRDGKVWFIKLFFEILEKCENSVNMGARQDSIADIFNCNSISDMVFTLNKLVKPKTKEFSLKSEKAKDYSFIENVKKIVEAEFCNPDFCIQSVIQMLDMNASYFGQKFRHNFDLSFNRYLLEYRLNYAVKLLMETDFRNKQIAEMCGFNSETYFVTIFKKNKGSSPKEYKNKAGLYR